MTNSKKTTIYSVTYPERVVKEAVDDGVDAAVAHRQPVHGRVDGDEEVLLRDVLVLGQVRSEVDEQYERVQRQPADGEHRHDHHQHLDHLRRRQPFHYSQK